MKENIKDLLVSIYGSDVLRLKFEKFRFLLESESRNVNQPGGSFLKDLPFNEKDSVVITGRDFFMKTEDYNHPEYFKIYHDKELENFFSALYILPYSFSLSDNRFFDNICGEADTDTGTLCGINEASSYRLMTDLVVNPCSLQNKWFEKFLLWDDKYKDYFITAEPGTVISSELDPRFLPVLTEFDTFDGKKSVLTTFSKNQAYLNCSNPEVMMEIIKKLFAYIRTGIQMIKFDAADFLWKDAGPSFRDPEKTHAAFKFFRALIREYAPRVIIIAETNIPYEDNLSYFGNGYDEAQMVLQSALPFLTLDAFLSGNASRLREWAAVSFDKPSENVSFFNFHASRGGGRFFNAKGFLNDDEKDNMLAEVEKRGGFVPYKNTHDGAVPSGIDINYLNAVSGDETENEVVISKYLAFQSVMFAVTGVPGIYIHNPAGFENYKKGNSASEGKSSVNRENPAYSELEKELSDPENIRGCILSAYRKMLYARKNEPAFNPGGRQIIPDASGPVFAVLRISPDKEDMVICLVNISGRIVKSFVHWDFLSAYKKSKLYDIISGEESGSLIIFHDSGKSDTGSECSAMLTLDPWEVVWLK